MGDMEHSTDNNINISKRTGLEIAVIGMAGRFPGAGNIAEFWDNIKKGIESIFFFSDDELLEAGIAPDLVKNPHYVKAKGMLAEIENFDYTFFEYTRREAEWMDPQFRILHETCWHALEDAGYNPDTYVGSIGLFVGTLANYQWVTGLLSRIGGHAEQTVIGSLNDRDFFATRVAYKLNLRGPALTVQTACSTSLTAIHMGCQSLLSGESDMVLAGASSVWLPAKSGYLYETGMVRSADGRTRAFDAAATGTNGGDSAAVVVLKRLADAEAEGDRIDAVVKGSAINNDGRRKIGYTAPSVEGQKEVIQAAMQMAEVEPETVTMLEAHGTATVLGDPVEIEALKLAFSTEKQRFCAIGSVKTNVGHLDAAAGAAGFIKSVMALKHRLIPPTLHFSTPNPHIDFDNSPFYVSTRLREWQSNENPRRAGVSSFGIGGTNVHVILEEWRSMQSKEHMAQVAQGQDRGRVSSPNQWREYHLILLSAQTPSALEQMTGNLAAYLKNNFLNQGNHENPINPGPTLADVSYTLQVGRKAFKYRRYTVANRVDDLIKTLAPTLQTHCFEGERRPLVFMFPGQGSQYVNMGRQLYETEPLFREEMDRCFKILKGLTAEQIKEILYPGEMHDNFNSFNRSNQSYRSYKSYKSHINRTEITQPVLFIFEYALARLLMEWGISPDAMIGHSIGEYTAACLAGVFSLAEALDLVVCRGRLMGRMSGGAMLSVGLAPAQLEPYLNPRLSLAAVNGPGHCVVSGSLRDLEELQRRLEETGIENRRLHVSHAFHSWMMDPVVEEADKEFARVTGKAPGIPYISNVTGQWITAEDAKDPRYWAAHLRKTVQFAAGIDTLMQLENPLFIEMGPGRVLSTLVGTGGKNRAQQVVPLIPHPRENQPEYYYLLNQLGQLWASGLQPDWGKFYNGEKRSRAALPTYPFDKHYFSVEISGQSKSPRHIPAPTGTPAYDRETPLNEVEKKLAAVLDEVLGLEKISFDDNFFQLGGDSLKAVAAVSKINREFQVDFPLAEILSGAALRQLAQKIKQTQNIPWKNMQSVEKKEYYPLSSAQKRLFFLAQLENIETAYNITTISGITGKFDRERFERAFKQLQGRHEALRTSFRMIREEPVQVIRQKVNIKIEHKEVGVKVERELADQSPGSFIDSFVRPFDLSAAPLLRVGVEERSAGGTSPENRHGHALLMFDMHHIISDGVSLDILANDFLSLYDGEDLLPLRVQYKDFAQWQKGEKERKNFQQQEQYWLKQFARQVPVMDIPCDYPRPVVQSFEGGAVNLQVEAGTTRALQNLAMEENVTLNILMIAINYVFLAKISGREDIVMGIDVANRRHADLERIVGMFVNTLALRNYPRGDKSFTQFLREVKKSTLAALENQEYPFEDLVDRLKVKRDPGRNPLFDVMFSFWDDRNPLERIPWLKNLGLRPMQVETGHRTAQFDLTVSIMKAAEHMDLSFEYCSKLFNETTIKKFISYFNKITGAILEKPGIKIWDIPIVSDEEKERLLKAIRPGEEEEFPGQGDEPGKLIEPSEVQYDF